MTEIELRGGQKPAPGPSMLRLADKPLTRATGWSPSEWRQKKTVQDLKPIRK